MPQDLAALMSQPMAPSPPSSDAATGNGRDQAMSLQSLMGQGPQRGGAQGMQGQAPAPDHQVTGAALHHLGEFQRQWRKMLNTPDIGKKDMKGQLIEMMADVMGEGLVSLPQTMSLLKSFPADPLQQRQWIEQHYKNDQQAAVALLQHHAAAFPGPDAPMPQGQSQQGASHIDLMKGLVNHYKSRSGKKHNG